jgi:hypothetical protein
MTGLCICGRPLPARRAGRAATHCSYWCAQVAKGTFTPEQVASQLERDRGPVPTPSHNTDLFGGAA